MAFTLCQFGITSVALRKESVDRNTSLSDLIISKTDVALRKESVDRNKRIAASIGLPDGRSPQGERG